MTYGRAPSAPSLALAEARHVACVALALKAALKPDTLRVGLCVKQAGLPEHSCLDYLVHILGMAKA